MRQILVLAIAILAVGVVTARFADTAVHTPPSNTATNATAVAQAGRIVTLRQDNSGQFAVAARVEGRRVEFVVDTGASVIVLRESEAARLGIRPNPGDYTAQVSTANGITRAAPVRLGSVDVDGVVVRDVAALVQPDSALGVNLLGMSYLSRVRFSHDRGQLIIEQ